MAASTRHAEIVRGAHLTSSTRNVLKKSIVVTENDAGNMAKLNYSDDKIKISKTDNEYGLAEVINEDKVDTGEIENVVAADAEKPMYDNGSYAEMPIFDVRHTHRGTSINNNDMDKHKAIADYYSERYLNHYNEEEFEIDLNVNESEREILVIEDDAKSHINERSQDILRTSSLCLKDSETEKQMETNDDNTARPVYVGEVSFRKTCFPQLWARAQSENRGKKKLKGKRKMTKGRKRKSNRCSTPFTIASWGTGFRSTSDISLVCAKPEKQYAGTYDIRYTSTGLILLNNRLKEEHSRLRKDDDRNETKTPKPTVNPERHSREPKVLSSTVEFITGNLPAVETPSNCYHHMQCFDSSSARFVSSASMRWLNSVTPTRFLEKYSVNQHRHRKCLDKLEESSTLDVSTQTDTPKPKLKTNILSPYAEKLTKK